MNILHALISVCAPTMQRTPEEKEQFHEKLGNCITAAKDDNIIVLGDLSARRLARIGNRNMNSNGLMILRSSVPDFNFGSKLHWTSNSRKKLTLKEVPKMAKK